MSVRFIACFLVAFSCTPPPVADRIVGRLSACDADDECPEGQACLGGKCTVTCGSEAECDATQVCIDAQCVAKIAPAITFASTTIELFAGEPAIDVTPTVVLGPHDSTAAIAWHEIVAPEDAVKTADFSGAMLHFTPLTVGHYAYEVTATHKGGSGRDVLIIRVSEDAIVGQMSRDNLGDGLYRLTTSGSLTLMHSLGNNEQFDGYRNLDNHSAAYAVKDTIRHTHYATAAFSPRYWSASAPSGATSDCASTANGRCCPTGYVIVDRNPDYFCCPSTHPVGVDPNQCCPASYRTVTAGGADPYEVCCPNDGFSTYEHDVNRVVGAGDFGACVLRTERGRLSVHQWSDKSSDNRTLATFFDSVSAGGSVCESGIDPAQVTTPPNYECEWFTRGIVAHPAGLGFAVLLEARSRNGIQQPTNEIVLFVQPKTLVSPLVVTDGVIAASKRLVHRKTAIPDGSRYFSQIAFRQDGALVVFAEGQNGATHRLLWFDPLTAASLGARDVARVGDGIPTLLMLTSDAMLVDATAFRLAPLAPAATAEEALGSYAGSAMYPALDAATQRAIERCGVCDTSVTSIPAYTDVACTNCCACLRDNGATMDPFATCQAQTGISHSRISTAIASPSGAKVLVTRRIFEASPPSCIVFPELPTRQAFELYDTATKTFTAIPAPSGMVLSNLSFDQGNNVGVVGFAAEGRQTLLLGPMSGDLDHINVWRRNQQDGSTEKLLPNDVTDACGAAQPNLVWFVIAAFLIRRRRRAP